MKLLLILFFLAFIKETRSAALVYGYEVFSGKACFDNFFSYSRVNSPKECANWCKESCVAFDYKPGSDKAETNCVYFTACNRPLQKSKWNMYKRKKDIDYCASDSCLNGGICHNGVNKYRCVCESGFTGANCEADLVVGYDAFLGEACWQSSRDYSQVNSPQECGNGCKNLCEAFDYKPGSNKSETNCVYYAACNRPLQKSAWNMYKRKKETPPLITKTTAMTTQPSKTSVSIASTLSTPTTTTPQSTIVGTRSTTSTPIPQLTKASTPTPPPTNASTPSTTSIPIPPPTKASTPSTTSTPIPPSTKASTSTPPSTKSSTPSITRTLTLLPTKASTSSTTSIPTPPPTKVSTPSATSTATPPPTKASTPSTTNTHTPPPSKASTPSTTNTPNPSPKKASTPSTTNTPNLSPTKASTPSTTNMPTSLPTKASTSTPPSTKSSTSSITRTPTLSITNTNTPITTMTPTQVPTTYTISKPNTSIATHSTTARVTKSTTSSTRSTRNHKPTSFAPFITTTTQSDVLEKVPVSSVTIVGAVVAVIVLIIFIIVVIIIIIRRKKNEQESEHQAPETRVFADNVYNIDDIVTDGGGNGPHCSNSTTVEIAMIVRSAKKRNNLNVNQEHLNHGGVELTDEMTTNTNYKSQDLSNPVANEMIDKTYYESQDISNTGLQLTEIIDSQNPETKVASADHKKEGVYVDTYAHFKLEGRKRSPYPTSFKD